MSPDDIDKIALEMFDFLVDNLGCDLGEDEDYEDLKQFLYDKLERFCTRDRNYN